MQTITHASFGPLISYLVPGITVLTGLSYFSPTLRSWLASSPAAAPTIGGFLYLTIAALAAGMIVSAVRWAVVDTFHAWTGIPSPTLNFSKLAGKVDAFAILIDIHYKHYLFYSNMFMATAIAFACYRLHMGAIYSIGWVDIGFAILEVIFFATSRDTLAKYYVRSQQLLQ